MELSSLSALRIRSLGIAVGTKFNITLGRVSLFSQIRFEKRPGNTVKNQCLVQFLSGEYAPPAGPPPVKSQNTNGTGFARTVRNV